MFLAVAPFGVYRRKRTTEIENCFFLSPNKYGGLQKTAGSAAASPGTSERTVVITGGTGGIGLHSAIGIARTGARVVAKGAGADCEDTDNRVELVLGDISSSAGVDALAHNLLE